MLEYPGSASGLPYAYATRTEPDAYCVFPGCGVRALDADSRCARHMLSRFPGVTTRSSTPAEQTHLGRYGNAAEAQDLLDQGFFPTGVDPAELEALEPGALVGWANRPETALLNIVFREPGPVLEERQGQQVYYVLPCLSTGRSSAPNRRTELLIPATQRVPVHPSILDGPWEIVPTQIWVMPRHNVNVFYWQ